jgi:putative ABC transport system permease protein
MQPVRQAFRALRAAPVASSVAILSLALGIGANTAIFSIFNSLLLKPLPVTDPDRLVVLDSGDGRGDPAVSYDVWKALREQRVLDSAFAWGTDRVDLSSTAETAFGDAIWATGDFFDVLGVRPILGRAFTRQDDVRGGGADGPVAVISYQCWQRRFGGTPSVIGRTLHVDRVPFTVVGVAPRGFFGVNVGTAFDVVLPLETEPQIGRVPARLDNRYWPWLRVMARLPGAQTAEGVTAAVRRVQPLIREATMPGYANAEDRDAYLRDGWTMAAAPAGVSRFRRQYAPALFTLLAVVAVVLLIACANIATLMLARAAARTREFSVRLALGASRGRLIRQLLAESLLMSAIGAALGLALAYWSSRVLVRQLSTWAYSAVLDLSLDVRVLAVTVLTTIATAVLFGAAPAFRAGRVQPNGALSRMRAPAAGARLGLAEGLVVAQIALSLALVVGAGLFLRSFVALAYRDLGFDRDRLLVAVVDMNRSAIAAEHRTALFERLREAVSGVPGVERAAVSIATPLGSAGVRVTPTVLIPTDTGLTPATRILANPVSPEWFDTYGTRLLAGRDFDADDRAGAPHVAIVNDAFARRYFGAGNVLGRTILEEREAEERRTWEIVGVAEDAAFTSVRNAVDPAIYRPLAQVAGERVLRNSTTISVTVRAAHGSPAGLSSALAAAIGAVDRRFSVSFLTVREQVDVFYIRERLLARLSMFFGGFALLLASLGVYGVMADGINRRRGEIAVRLALGAAPAAVLRMIAGRVAVMLGLGLVAGSAASWWTGRYVAALLYAVEPLDTRAFGAAVALLTITVGLAAWAPARRAASTDPAAALRDG